jgi:hypothetical protein
MRLVKIKSKELTGSALFVVASIENDIGTLVGPYSLNLPEVATEEEIAAEILRILDLVQAPPTESPPE